MGNILSIITINYNDAKGLEKTIASVTHQTFKGFEYIIIDGASTDGSVEIIKKNENKIDYWVSEPDDGIYNAMNKGIAQASGKYLLFLNSGDYIFEQTTIQQLIGFLNDDVSFISGNVNMLSEQPWIKRSPKEMTHSFLYQNSLPHPGTFIHHNMFNLYGNYDLSYPVIADWVFFFKAIVLNAESYLHINNTISSFDMSGISSYSDHTLKRLDFLRIVHPYAQNNYLDDFLINQFVNPNKRVQLIARIESNRLLRKFVTVLLYALNFFSFHEK